MALVNYSDSEASDDEETVPVSSIATPTNNDARTAPPASASKPAFQKLTSASEPRKIRLDLPSIQPETSEESADEPPAKRAKTSNAFSGFNSFLPAPKRSAAPNVPKAGVSLRTSSEAAFSRASLPSADDMESVDINLIHANERDVPKVNDDVKVVGKATRFKPLSVAGKKKTIIKTPKQQDPDKELQQQKSPPQEHGKKEAVVTEQLAPPIPKPKRSLFSVPQEDDTATTPSVSAGTYESITGQQLQEDHATISKPISDRDAAAHPPPVNSLQSLTSDLNLTAAQRRQLFGRAGAPGKDINITHFDMEHEYAANEQLRQAGEVVEHRAVKAIAPGKHSLQQLVNNARSQQESLEDKWAQGRRERGGTGAGYGWAGK